MTRYTKLERKRHVDAGESFAVTPLQPSKKVETSAPAPAAPKPEVSKEKTENSNKRKAEGEEKSQNGAPANKKAKSKKGKGGKADQGKTKKKKKRTGLCCSSVQSDLTGQEFVVRDPKEIASLTPNRHQFGKRL